MYYPNGLGRLSESGHGHEMDGWSEEKWMNSCQSLHIINLVWEDGHMIDLFKIHVSQEFMTEKDKYMVSNSLDIQNIPLIVQDRKLCEIVPFPLS